MQTVGRSPDISVMWRTEYYAGAGYIRHVAVKRLSTCSLTHSCEAVLHSKCVVNKGECWVC